MCVCRGRRSESSIIIPHYITKNEFMYNIQWRVQEFVRRGGGRKSEKQFFFAFYFFKWGWGAAQKIAEK